MKQRELKFRAWIANEMFYKNNATIFSHSNVPKILIMQYTGLKDKNGTEIYEGDIVEIDDEYFKIYFNERSAGFQLDRLGMEKASNEFISNVIDELEVVGNIYENPDISNDFNNGFRCKVKW